MHAALWVAILVLFVAVIYRIWLKRIDRQSLAWAEFENDPEKRRQALRRLDDLIAKKPQNSELRYQRACLRRLERDFAGVVEDMAVRVQRSHGKYSDEDWRDYAEALMFCQRYDEALTALEQAFRLDRYPAYSAHWALQARLALLLGHDDLARQSLDKWKDSNPPGSPEENWDNFTWFLHECAYQLRQGATRDACQKAQSALNKVTTRYPEMLDEIQKTLNHDEPALIPLFQALDNNGIH